MSLEQLEKTVLGLPREERRRFADWFYTHEEEILALQDDDKIQPAVRAEILRRSSELEVNSSLALPVTDQWFGELKRRLADASASQAPAS